MWLPVLYGVVVLSDAGRYWRWLLLLGILGIGSTNWLGWFRGFALIAMPAKVGAPSFLTVLKRFGPSNAAAVPGLLEILKILDDEGSQAGESFIELKTRGDP